MEKEEHGSTEITEKQSQEKKKRCREENIEPVLVRLPSGSPSCSSDYIHINKDQFRIGRKPDNDEVILSVWISRNHCILHYDHSNNKWLVTNLSSTDTLINRECIKRNKTEVINEGDILQLSLSDSFRYKFTLNKNGTEFIKNPKLESNECALGTVLNKQKSFVACQENERKHLEKQLIAKQQEQEKLKEELEKLLHDQKVTKSCNEELNSEIADLQKKIELGNSTELELQAKYCDLLEKLKEERFKFEEELAAEKQKWQQALQKTKEEKEKLEMTMVEKMEEWKEQLEKKQQAEWKQKIDSVLNEEKNVQTRLLDEKEILMKKLKEMENTLKDKEKLQHNAVIATLQPVDIQKCIILEVQPEQGIQEIPVIETIDLTNYSSNQYNQNNCQKDTVIDKVNHIMDEQLTCSICSELFVRAMTLNCMHTFCRHCIDTWIKRKRVCPDCRTTIVSMTRSLVVDNFIEKMLESLTPEQMQQRKQLIEERKKSSIKNTKQKVGKK